MLSWFRATCPCDSAAKQWVEGRLAWLSRQFGLHLWLERPIILPTPEFFPDPYDGSAATVGAMFRRVCEYMQVDPDVVSVQLFGDRTSAAFLDFTKGFAAGTWQAGKESWKPAVVRIEKTALDRPADLVATMAHELAHQRLLGERRTTSDAYDNELLTDLTAMYHGFGVFLANNPRRSTGKQTCWPGTNLIKPEYLSEPMLAYALAHQAWFRNEARPEWVRKLRWAPRAAFKQGLRYLQETAHSSFRPVWLGSEDL